MFEIEKAENLVSELIDLFEMAKRTDQTIDQKEFRLLMGKMYHGYRVLLPPQDLSICDKCKRPFDENE